MQLNHIDLQLPDVQEAASFFERFFGFERLGNHGSPAIAILRGDGPFTLVIQRRAEGERYPENFHIGFLVPTVEQLHAFHARATAEGLSISPIQRGARGTLTYCRGPGDLLIEVSHR